MDETMHMIETNIFRPHSPIKRIEDIEDISRDYRFNLEERLDSHWPYLSNIYEFFMQLAGVNGMLILSAISSALVVPLRQEKNARFKNIFLPLLKVHTYGNIFA